MTSSVVRLRRSSKALPKVKLTPKIKKVLVTVQWSDAGLIHYSLLNPSETITSEKYAQLAQQWAYFDEMHQKLQHLQSAFFNRMGPILPHDNAQLRSTQPKLQKSNKLDYKVLPHMLYLPDLLPTNYHFFKHLNNFLHTKCFHKQRDAENAFKESIESRSTDIYTTGINKLISHW